MQLETVNNWKKYEKYEISLSFFFFPLNKKIIYN